MFFQVASVTATRYGLSRGLLGLKYDQIKYSDSDSDSDTIIVLRSLFWISKNTDSITCGMNTDRSSRFTYVKLLFINNPTPPRPSSVSDLVWNCKQW